MRAVIRMGLVADDIGPVLARDQFLRGESVEAAVRGPILNSWQRSVSLGLSPDGCELPFVQDLDLDGRLVRAAGPVLDRLRERFAGRSVNVSLADGRGAVLQRRFGQDSMAARLPAIQTVPGFVFNEKFAGTNGIGLALAERRLIHVYGAEHFAERSQANACSAMPVRDPLSGRIEGVLCLGYPHTDVDVALDIVMSKAAGAIEQRLLEQSSARERSLLQAYLDIRRRLPAADGLPLRPVTSGLDWRDRMILEERATELISAAQRAAVEVALPSGRRVTLVSRPVTSASGVEGVVVEAVVPTADMRLAVPTGITPPTEV
ncbi:protein phosphatase, partial [Streptomyces sp. UNOB3_S3]|nr:protein phosphatase [Streptomyces sp. UNOB3_S3]